MPACQNIQFLPSGTIAPAHVFIIGVGVAGLQAIATAKRLGARVEAFDTRPVVEEQVHSLGAKFIKIENKVDDYYSLKQGVYPKKSLRNRHKGRKIDVNFKQWISYFSGVYTKREVEFEVSLSRLPYTQLGHNS